MYTFLSIRIIIYFERRRSTKNMTITVNLMVFICYTYFCIFFYLNTAKTLENRAYGNQFFIAIDLFLCFERFSLKFQIFFFGKFN